MLLRKFYSEPADLFPAVNFKDGINFVFAKKEKSTDSKKSLNGVGKTLLLDLIDYALLASDSKLIAVARQNNKLDDYLVVLEFEVDGKSYLIKRPLGKKRKEIFFGETTDPKEFKSTEEVKKALCDLIFYNADYKGKYSNKWLRKLIPFFIKKQSKETSFSDPIKYIPQAPEMELIPYHLFLMGIDNSLVHKNYNLQDELKKKAPAMEQVKNFIEDTYRISDIAQAESEIDRINAQVERLEADIKNFKLARHYENAEQKSNELTAKIKGFWYQNFLDKRKIDQYRESFAISDDVNLRKIKRMYEELNVLFANNIEATLKEALEFRKNLAESRREFIQKEIVILEKNIVGRAKEIANLERDRAEVFSFLAAKDAISDLSEAYFELSRQRRDLSDLSGKIKLYQDLEREEADLKREAANLYSEIVGFVQEIQKQLSDFRKKFFEIHDAIYVENKNKSIFSLNTNDRKDSKMDINVVLPADLSKGKNQGRTLIYDLTMLFHAIEKGIRSPRFLIHDGIFDSMDKAHFVHLYEYLEELVSQGKRFQYIVSLNEEGTLSDSFGNAEKVNPAKISEEAIITLTPNRKLFGKEWD